MHFFQFSIVYFGLAPRIGYVSHITRITHHLTISSYFNQMFAFAGDVTVFLVLNTVTFPAFIVLCVTIIINTEHINNISICLFT